jgi:hypothetical protein
VATEQNGTAKARSGKVAAAPSGVLDEPEELQLWRRIAAFRDLLAKSMTGWEGFLARQRAARTPEAVAERSGCTVEEAAERQAADEWVTKQSESYIEGTIATNRDALVELDNRVRALRRNKGKNYGIGKLRAVLELFDQYQRDRAIALVRAYLDKPSDAQLKIAAASALFDLRNHEPRPAASVLDVGDVDIDRLVADERKERFAKNEYNSTVAPRIVARAAGLPPHTRKLR